MRFLALLVVIAGCSPAATVHPKWPDAALELRDDADRDQAIDHLWVVSGATRDRERDRVAAAIAHRISETVEDDQPFVAAALLDQLTWMWNTDPQAIGRGLAPHAQLLGQLRAMFAKAGALEPAVQTLVLLAEVDPGHRTQHLAELDEILAFADELAITENGDNATRGQPIALLQPTALALPLPWLVDRYVDLLVERQRIVAKLLDAQGASMQLVRAHHDILSTARRIANVLARAGRPAEIYRHLANMNGIGTDRELAARAEIVADQPTADAYAELAGVLRVDEHTPDAAAALAVCMAGLAKFPRDPALLAAAGGDAHTLGRIDQAIAFYEQALHATGELDAAIALQLGKLYAERIQRLANGGRPQAAAAAWHEALEFTADVASAHPHTVWQQAAAIAESALGRGLASQGMLADARHALRASLERAPSIDAYEALVTIDVQTDQYSDARKWANAGIAMLGEQSSGDRYRRAKLERLAADALRREGRGKEAAARYLDSLRAWSSLGESKDLPRGVAAERELDMGRTMWWLGDPDKAVDLVMQAVESDPETPSITADAITFLIQAGRYRDALDAYHRGLGEPAINEYYKVYTSLWIVGEAKRLGEPADHLALEYLGSRRGDTWYEKLAQAAAGKLPFDEVRALATTGPRKAELAFYGATLGIDPAAATPAGKKQLLEEVIAAHLVLDSEYDLARLYLAQPQPLAAAPGEHW